MTLYRNSQWLCSHAQCLRRWRGRIIRLPKEHDYDNPAIVTWSSLKCMRIGLLRLGHRKDRRRSVDRQVHYKLLNFSDSLEMKTQHQFQASVPCTLRMLDENIKATHLISFYEKQLTTYVWPRLYTCKQLSSRTSTAYQGRVWDTHDTRTLRH